MVRVVENRRALPNGLILAVHVRHDPSAGVEFIAENVGGAGVRLKKAKPE